MIKVTNEMLALLREYQMGAYGELDDDCDKRMIAALIELHEANKPKPEQLNLDHYDAGLLGGSSLCDVSWWHNYLIVELERAHDHYQSQVDCLTQYTTPPTREPLTKHERFEIITQWDDETGLEELVLRVERAHGIGVTNA